MRRITQVGLGLGRSLFKPPTWSRGVCIKIADSGQPDEHSFRERLLSGIRCTLANQTGRNLYFPDELFLNLWCKNQRMLAKGEDMERRRKHVCLDLPSYVDHIRGRKKMADETSIKHLCQHLNVFIHGCEMTGVSQTKEVSSVGEHYKSYKEQCKVSGREPWSFKEFCAALAKEAHDQKISCIPKNLRQQDIILFRSTIEIDEYSIKSASRTLAEIEFRNVYETSALVRTKDPLTLIRFAGYRDFELTLSGNAGLFFNTGLPVVGQEPLENGMPIHPVIANSIIAVGTGARQPLTDKHFVLPARQQYLSCPESVRRDEAEYVQWLQHQHKLLAWNDVYMNHLLKNTVLIEYHVPKGALIGIGKGLTTDEVYIAEKIDPARLSAYPLNDGADFPVFCSKSNQLVRLKLDSRGWEPDLSYTDHLKVAVRSNGVTPNDCCSASIDGTAEELTAFSQMREKVKDEFQITMGAQQSTPHNK